jgi:hypothetical protein
VTDQDATVRDLAALVRAVLYGDRTATACAERITSRLIGEDASTDEIEAGLRKALAASPLEAAPDLARLLLAGPAEKEAAAGRYERLAVDGDGDAWACRGGRWRCLTAGGGADDDAELAGQYPPVTFYAPSALSAATAAGRRPGNG